MPLTFYYSKKILDILSKNTIENMTNIIMVPAICYFLFLLLQFSIFRILHIIKLTISPLIQNKIIIDFFQLMSLESQKFFLEHPSGEISENIMMLSEETLKIIFERGFMILYIITALFISLFVIYNINVFFFYILISVCIIFIIVNIFYFNKIISASELQGKKRIQISGHIVNNFKNIETIQLFFRFFHEKTIFQPILDAYKNTYKNRELQQLYLDLIQSFFVFITNSIILFLVIYLKNKNDISIGDCAAILGLTWEFQGWLWYLFNEIRMFYESLGKCYQSLNFLMTKNNCHEMTNAVSLNISRGNIEFNHIHFSYDQADFEFKNFSLKILGGSKIGIVGTSGHGKSTLLKLILRMNEITSGSICIDDQNISEVTLASLRNGIGCVFQETSLFSRSIFDNIRYGRLDATDEEVIKAAKLAQAHEFIMKLPKQYHSIIGEKGLDLSGGQCQRICIARVFLKNAPILLCDEATSQLDLITEHQVINAMKHFMTDKTVLFIAHRLASVQFMDRILVIEKGSVVEEGTHEELILLNGYYKKLWDTQI
jgi:ATP-binding cassette subfamily B protein